MPIKETIKNIVRKDKSLDKYIWDEWCLYKDIKNFLKVYEKFYLKFCETAKKYDYICSVGKSGFPLAAKFSFDIKKPLIISSLSEYIYEGRTFVLGVPPDVDIKNKKVFCIDSHTRTGGSIELADKLLKSRNIKDVDYFVLFDCRDFQNRKLHINSLYKWNEIEPQLLEFVPANRISDDEFWMKEDKYWLMSVNPQKWDLPSNDIPPKSSKQIVLMEEKYSQFMKDGKIEPLQLYMDPDAFHLFIEKCMTEIKGAGIDTIIAASVTAIPIAFVLSTELNSCSNQFIFIMNESIDYYNNILSKTKAIALCDDVMLSGGLLYAIAKLLIGENYYDKIKFLITIFNLTQFPESGRKYIRYLIAKASPVFLTAFEN